MQTWCQLLQRKEHRAVEFKRGIEWPKDDPRSGRSSTVTTKENVDIDNSPHATSQYSRLYQLPGDESNLLHSRGTEASLDPILKIDQRVWRTRLHVCCCGRYSQLRDGSSSYSSYTSWQTVSLRETGLWPQNGLSIQRSSTWIWDTPFLTHCLWTGGTCLPTLKIWFM